MTVSSAVQFMKAAWGISVTPAGRVMEVSAAHPEKVPVSRATVSGLSVTEVSRLHPENP